MYVWYAFAPIDAIFCDMYGAIPLLSETFLNSPKSISLIKFNYLELSANENTYVSLLYQIAMKTNWFGNSAEALHLE